jgi:hypothetical protein
MEILKAEIRNLETPCAPPLRIGPAEMAKRLGIKRRALTDWQRKRLIPFERIGPAKGRSIILFDGDAVDKALKCWRVKSVGD